MKVRDFMITRVFTVKPTNTVEELLNILNTNRIGGVPVVDDRGNLLVLHTTGGLA